MNSRISPTRPPETKAISDRMIVHPVAISRLERMSQKENCSMSLSLAHDLARKPVPTFRDHALYRRLEQISAEPAQNGAHGDCEQQVNHRGQDIDLEIAEIARGDEIGGVGQILRGNLRHHRRAEHDDD